VTSEKKAPAQATQMSKRKGGGSGRKRCQKHAKLDKMSEESLWVKSEEGGHYLEKNSTARERKPSKKFGKARSSARVEGYPER